MMSDAGHETARWYDDEAGPVVRPYAMTRGRTSATGGHRLDLIALVSAVPPPGDPGPGGPAGAREPDRPRGTAADRGGGPRTGPDEGVRTGPDAGTGGADPGESASTTAPAAPPWPLPPEQDALLTPEHVEILALCGGAPQSVAEIAAGLDLAIGVVRVLVSDLAEAELVTVTRPVPPAELPDESVLRDVIEGLRAL
ncbi:DUF742 domain-containing protein [Streptomyces sp. NPDC001255]|uniref:DUF742 domain-containing protein n=1 Tax=Streptomyces sp. NPDC001255 TaxID=3364550 RepID=UPI0036AB9264